VDSNGNEKNLNNNKPFRGPHLEGYNVEQCRAMALLALGDPNLYELVLFDVYFRFHDLKEGRIDVMPDGSTHTMERDTWFSDTEAAFAFTVPYFYSGLTFAGKPVFVDCVDTLDTFNDECRDLKICVSAGSTHVGVLREILQGSVLVLSNSTDVLVEQYDQDQCNVVAGEKLFLGKLPLTYPSVTLGWKYSGQVVSKEPLAIVTRNDDPEWSDLANLVVNTFILAEANNITKESSHLMVNLFEGGAGDLADGERTDLVNLMVSLIDEFGNHGELYAEYIQDQIPRDAGLNQPYNSSRSNGLLYSIPFGDLNNYGPDPVGGGTLEQVIERDYLVCGVHPLRGPFFASPPNVANSSDAVASNSSLKEEFSGFDVGFCRGLAASIFTGDKDKVVFVELMNICQLLIYFGMISSS
jgi:general L-amino acid transport system substrate-binding protein